MEEGDRFSLTPPRVSPPDSAWPSAIFFETPAEIYQRVYRLLAPRSAKPDVRVRFEKFANADSIICAKNGVVEVRITDILERAPAPIQESLAFILVGKLLKKKIPPVHNHRYRLYIHRKDVRALAQTLKQERGRKLHSGPVGDFFHLEEIFERLNQTLFHGLMARPELGWSHQRSRTRLGHYDLAHHTIIISRVFDLPDSNGLALEYVMFHEMLHLKYPVEHSGGRRCVHTKAFKAAEKEYPRLAEAKRLLKML